MKKLLNALYGKHKWRPQGLYNNIVLREEDNTSKMNASNAAGRGTRRRDKSFVEAVVMLIQLVLGSGLERDQVVGVL